MDKKDTNIVGTRIGLYDVLYECDFKSNDGHRMFHVKCSECGWESNVQMHQIKMLSKKCKHINLAGQYSTDKAKIIWNNKRIFKIYQGMIQRCYNPNNKNISNSRQLQILQEQLEYEEKEKKRLVKAKTIDGKLKGINHKFIPEKERKVLRLKQRIQEVENSQQEK